MAFRVITSEIYGNLGRFERVRPGLFRSESGRVHVLGNGNPNGKGEGTLFLDHAKYTDAVTGYDVPRSLVVCDDYFGIHPQSVAPPTLVTEFDQRKLDDIFLTLAELKFRNELAMRSSARADLLKNWPLYIIRLIAIRQ
ncbi:hypothetical protein HZC34_05650 [Candidatus Saganbacteria bacterium]|nr:hypothetical protein [Candidatus Saganbacteria bacterium]